jgi:hypothetical protein
VGTLQGGGVQGCRGEGRACARRALRPWPWPSAWRSATCTSPPNGGACATSPLHPPPPSPSTGPACRCRGHVRVPGRGLPAAGRAGAGGAQRDGALRRQQVGAGPQAEPARMARPSPVPARCPSPVALLPDHLAALPLRPGLPGAHRAAALAQLADGPPAWLLHRGGAFPTPQYCDALAWVMPAADGADARGGVGTPAVGSAVVLLGDAIHCFPPDLGQGVNRWLARRCRCRALLVALLPPLIEGWQLQASSAARASAPCFL